MPESDDWIFRRAGELNERTPRRGPRLAPYSPPSPFDSATGPFESGTSCASPAGDPQATSAAHDAFSGCDHRQPLGLDRKGAVRSAIAERTLQTPPAEGIRLPLTPVSFAKAPRTAGQPARGPHTLRARQVLFGEECPSRRNGGEASGVSASPSETEAVGATTLGDGSAKRQSLVLNQCDIASGRRFRAGGGARMSGCIVRRILAL